MVNTTFDKRTQGADISPRRSKIARAGEGPAGQRNFAHPGALCAGGSRIKAPGRQIRA